MNPASAPTTSATVAVIGAGRVGGVLTDALRAARYTVHGPLRRDEPIPVADIALLAVPDAAIPTAAASARPHATLIGHLSGATPLDDADFSIHPLQTFTGTETPDVFRGIGAAVAGRTADALAAAEHLARALGAHAFPVDDAHRAGYHAAASIASNLLLAVLDAAEQVATASGIREPRRLLAPLVERTVANWTRTGARPALTGPIARGDEGTVSRQRDAVVAAAPELGALFDVLGSRVRALAAEHPSAEHPSADPISEGAA